MRDGTRNEPPCWSKPCSYSELAIPETTPFLEMFFLLKSEVISGNALGREILKRAGGLHPDVLELMAELEVIVKSWHAEKQKAQASERANARDFQRIFR